MSATRMPSKKMPEGGQSIAVVLPTLVALVLVLLIAVADSLRPLPVHAAPISSAQASPSNATAQRITQIAARRGTDDLDVAEYLAAGGRAREVKDCSRPGVTCSCQDWTFSQPTWNLTDFRYRASLETRSPDDENDAVSRREVSFVVRNKAVPYSTSCEASSNATDDFFYGDEWYTCDQHGDGESDEGPGLTWFRYDKADDMIEVKQTWLCSDHGRVSFQAIGESKAVVECDMEVGENPDWEEGEIYQKDTKDCFSTDQTLRVPWSEIIGS